MVIKKLIFKLNLETDGYYQFTSVERKISYIEIYDNNNNLLIKENYLGSICPNLKAGTYYIKVYSYEVGSHFLKVTKN